MLTGISSAASDVPVALRKSKPKRVVSTGTITIPPPMPNMPDRMPAAMPRIKSATGKSGIP
jgi:hypothetical protein